MSHEAALDPVLELVLERVRVRAKRRTAWLQKLWNEEGEPGGKFAVTHAEIKTHLDDRDSPAAEAEWFASDNSVDALNRQIEKIEKTITQDGNSRFSQVHHIFGLGERESDLFQACLAIALDPSLARVYAYLQDHAGRNYVTDDLAARLFGHGRGGLWSPESSLSKWELVTEKETGPGEPSILACDMFIRDWVKGNNHLDPLLIGIASEKLFMPALNNWPVDETAKYIRKWIKGGEVVRVRIVGFPGSGRRTLAAEISKKLDLRMLAVNSDKIGEHDWPRVFVHAQRQAHLDRFALGWYGDGVLRWPWPQVVPWVPVQYVICEPGEVLSPMDGVLDHKVEIPKLSLKERRALWRQLVPVSKKWPKGDIEKLVSRHGVTVGDIASVAAKDVDSANMAEGIVREAARHRLGDLAQLLECTFTWEDLVVPDSLRQALKDIEFEAKERAGFWEQPEARRLFPQGQGLIALFSGPSGTGKTMAAQVIAASLGLDLFRCNLAQIVSKYVGESSKNIERILTNAANMDIVLFFDEADALFGKRTEIRDAHDRFANTDTNYLLQAIENYQGIALLATNKKENIDTAFIRRLRYVLEFPKPDTGQRLCIWSQLIRELAGKASLDAVLSNLKALAEKVEVTGAQVKYAVLGGLFAARHERKQLNMQHLLRGLERELMKEGGALSDRERESLLKNG